MVARPGAEPFRHDGGPVGALLCHGFTGSPASMRPWADHLASAGLSVRLPLLPGHGTEWQQLQITRWPDWYACLERELLDLAQQCEHVFVMGLSMGGTLTLRLALERPEVVSGIAVVNASVHSKNQALRALPVLRHVKATVPGIRNDIKKPNQDELAYPKVPLQALHSLTELWEDVAPRLGRINCPMIAFGSDDDHVVEPSNSVEIVQGVNSKDVTFIPLHNSYHVATLDNDAPLIFEQSLAFVQRISTHQATAWDATGLQS
ncbi:MAG: alpha/beta fold hydrolase [Actinomycetia bacterium]|nr:alpha/beta fold hydrolase [Actinomycetes bacterium]